MAEDRMKTIYRHLNPTADHTENYHAFGMQNPMKTGVYKSNYSETRKPSKPKRFKYTMDNNQLSTEQRLFYEENGFIVIPQLVSLDSLAKYKQRFNDICDNKVQDTVLTIMKDVSYSRNDKNERVINKIQDFVFDDVLFDYCQLPQILDYVKCFCGSNIKAMHTMLINKPPDSGSLSSRHPLHQDLHYFPFRPADKIVCSWTAMEKVNRANGCLVAIPGSHTGPLFDHDYPDWEGGVNKMYHGISSMDGEKMSKRVYLDMEAGDTVLFHPLLIHGSGANKTSGFRKAISCHYAACECEYIDVRNTTQEKLQNEILNLARKRGFDIQDMKYIWQLKSRLVHGRSINL